MRSIRPSRFDILVCYDVNTTEPAGRKRLRHVAKVCTGYGQRVQYSIFECTVSELLLDRMRAKLLDIINRDEDSLRIYHLHGSREERLEVFGRDGWVDFTGPLVA